MIYFYEFLKGVAVALLIFGAWHLFEASNSLIYLCLGAVPGLLLLMISLLLIENDELKETLKEKQDEIP